MITMQKTGEASVQSFSLPLTILPSSEKKKSAHGGLLDLTIKYRHSKSKLSQLPTKKTSLEQTTQVSLSIEIIRACGLKVIAPANEVLFPSCLFSVCYLSA